MYVRLPHGILDHGPIGGHSIVTVCRRHHVLYLWIDGRGAPRLYHVGHILGFLGLAAK